jgi:hypothetical protein
MLRSARLRGADVARTLWEAIDATPSDRRAAVAVTPGFKG